MVVTTVWHRINSLSSYGSGGRCRIPVFGLALSCKRCATRGVERWPWPSSGWPWPRLPSHASIWCEAPACCSLVACACERTDTCFCRLCTPRLARRSSFHFASLLGGWDNLPYPSSNERRGPQYASTPSMVPSPRVPVRAHAAPASRMSGAASVCAGIKFAHDPSHTTLSARPCRML